jgi:hypothetical protein
MTSLIEYLYEELRYWGEAHSEYLQKYNQAVKEGNRLNAESYESKLTEAFGRLKQVGETIEKADSLGLID